VAATPVAGAAPSAPPAAGEQRWILGLPSQVTVTADDLTRGRERYNIYCAPCHGYDGQGTGAVKQRADAIGQALNPVNLVEATAAAIKMPNGQLYNTISNGKNTMMGYKEQVPVADRWRIVLYVRALQRASNATQADVPSDQVKNIP